MILPNDVKCCVCKKVFCCVKCREKHEAILHGDINHTKDKMYDENKIDCPICDSRPLLFKQDISGNVINHICEVHLPLQCKKCSKLFNTQKDLSEFSNCLKKNKVCDIGVRTPLCGTENDNQEKSSEKYSLAVATQTSPALLSADNEKNDVLTPISKWNLLWKVKSKTFEGSITDSASSLRNVSSINNTGGNANVAQNNISKAKLVRSTSTPMQRLISKVKENRFDGSSCHVSSIYCSSSESDVSPPIKILAVTPSPDMFKQGNQLKKNLNHKGKTKGYISVTPLRHVMSKSIQRAIAEHGVTQCRESNLHPKKIFDSLETNSSIESPLDLRTTPVLRRTKSEIITRSSNFDFSSSSRTHSDSRKIISKKHNVEEIIITSTCNDSKKLETVYESCRSIEVSTTYFLHDNNLFNKKENMDPIDDISPITPKITGGALKKAISFDSSHLNYNDLDETVDDVFYTPTKSQSPPSVELPVKMKINDEIITKPSTKLNNFIENKDETKTGKIWSLFSSVIRLASGSLSEKPKAEDNTAPSLVKRCASFTGFLSRSKSPEIDQDLKSNKRRRTSTVDGQIKIYSESTAPLDYNAPPKRPKRIQCRQPIERMRNK